MTFLFRTALAVFLALLPNFAFAGDLTVETARAAGVHGLAPDFSQSLRPASQDRGRRVAWEDYGISFGAVDRRAFVSGLRPDGPAVLAGATVGDLIRSNLFQLYARFAELADAPAGDRDINLAGFEGKSLRAKTFVLTPVSSEDATADIPVTLRVAAASNPGLMAILNADPKGADPAAIGRDAMLALQAISVHFNQCSGPRAVDIPIEVTRTTTTRDGFGTFKGSESDRATEVLRVRPEFADWARRNIAFYRSGPISTVRGAIVEMLTLEGCNGAGPRQLNAGLAAVMGVALPDAGGGETGAPGALPPTADAFIANCYPAQIAAARARGQTLVSERGTATICFCEEHAARAVGDVTLYDSLQAANYDYWTANPQFHDRFRDTFDQCYRAPDGSDLRRGIEGLWQRMQI